MLIQLWVWLLLPGVATILCLMPWAWHMSVMAAKCPGVGWSNSLRGNLQPWTLQPNCWSGDTETSVNCIWCIWENHAKKTSQRTAPGESGKTKPDNSSLVWAAAGWYTGICLTGELFDHLNYKNNFYDTAFMSIKNDGPHISVIKYSMHYFNDVPD